MTGGAAAFAKRSLRPDLRGFLTDMVMHLPLRVMIGISKQVEPLGKSQLVYLNFFETLLRILNWPPRGH